MSLSNGSEGMVMPVAPMYGGNGWGNGFGGDGWWVILFLFALMGNGGWGGFGAGRAIVTPSAVAAEEPPTQNNFFNVTSTAIITVPKGCCFNVSVENTSEGATPAEVAPQILVQNANLTVTRIA